MSDSLEPTEATSQAAGAAVLEKKPNFFGSIWKKVTGGEGKGPPPPPTASGAPMEDNPRKDAADETGVFSKN